MRRASSTGLSSCEPAVSVLPEHQRDNAWVGIENLSGSVRYFFEDYALDTDPREPQRGSDVVPTTPQVFDVLDYLIRDEATSS
jgi:hypothetical protein